ncbi:MAG: hypothetical protein WAU81_05140, partial [Candidatus Aminicenantales bacterium]
PIRFLPKKGEKSPRPPSTGPVGAGHPKEETLRRADIYFPPRTGGADIRSYLFPYMKRPYSSPISYYLYRITINLSRKLHFFEGVGKVLAVSGNYQKEGFGMADTRPASPASIHDYNTK